MGGRTCLRFCLRELVRMSLDKSFYSLNGKRRVKAYRIFSVLFLIALITGCGGGGSGGGSSPATSNSTSASALVPPICADGDSAWYCPQTFFSSSAIQQGSSGSPQVNVPFTIGNFETLNSSGNHVIPIGGPNSTFDWGLPFYFNQNVYIGIKGKSSSLGTGPLFASGPFSQSSQSSSDVNVMPITVDGNLCIQGAYNNEPCVSVKVCAPGSTTNCPVINGILLDTGSYGLRIFKSELNGVALTQTNAGNGGQLAECMQFADGSAEWGPVEIADVTLGSGSGETAKSVPIQVIDSTFPGSSNCNGILDTSPSAVGYNGILGVGPLAQDCGQPCTDPNNFSQVTVWPYWSCNNGSCAKTTVSIQNQVQNPVSSLPQPDNNGVVVELPGVSNSGAASLSGSLVLGIGTDNNNTPSGVTTLPLDPFDGDFTTIYNNASYTDSFIDTGSNGLFFPQAK